MSISSSTSTSHRQSVSSSLLVRVGSQDPDAWRRLTELYGPLVFHWCRQCRLSDEDAGDVVQEVFASVARAIHGYLEGEDGSFRGWLWTITRNQIRDLCRRKARQFDAQGGTHAHLQLSQHPQPIEPIDDDEPDPADPSATGQLFRRALDLVRSEFNDRTWEAFWRATVDEHSTADIAADLGISANAVRQCKSRVLRRLRQELGEQPR